MSKLRHVYYNLFTICLQVNSDLYCGFLGYCVNEKAVICPVRGKLLRDVEARALHDHKCANHGRYRITGTPQPLLLLLEFG